MSVEGNLIAGIQEDNNIEETIRVTNISFLCFLYFRGTIHSLWFEQVKNVSLGFDLYNSFDFVHIFGRNLLMKAENRYIFPPFLCVCRLVSVHCVSVTYGGNALSSNTKFHSLAHSMIISSSQNIIYEILTAIQPYLYYIKKIDLMRILID